MPKWIQPARVRTAIIALADWRQQAKSQAAMHLWPLLALKEKGANSDTWVDFEEADDADFWNRYARFPDEKRDKGEQGNFTKAYYIDPLVRETKPSDHPHRGPSTIRDRTFRNSWHAAEEHEKQWRLAKNWSQIFESKVLRRGDVIHRIPVVDLAVWLFRDVPVNEDADAKHLESTFRRVFQFKNDAEYDRLFVFHDEPPETLYTHERQTGEDYRPAIEDALLSDETPVVEPAPLYGADSSKTTDLDEDDEVPQKVKELLAISTSGIIFRGCPGTSKTWYAKQIARYFVESADHIYQVQFHPSYGYEDFVEGYRPDESAKSGFKVTDKIFLDACDKASKIEGRVVFIIDEINRGDPARIFGEMLTYIEFGYRGDKFQRAYTGQPTSVPANLLILGTMNQTDKSITQLDSALLRRFDHIDLSPSSEVVEHFLERASAFTAEQVSIVSDWFENLQNLVAIGHTYFNDVRKPEHVWTVWKYRMFPYCQAALELDPPRLENVRKSFDAMHKRLIGQTKEGESP